MILLDDGVLEVAVRSVGWVASGEWRDLTLGKVIDAVLVGVLAATGLALAWLGVGETVFVAVLGSVGAVAVAVDSVVKRVES